MMFCTRSTFKKGEGVGGGGGAAGGGGGVGAVKNQQIMNDRITQRNKHSHTFDDPCIFVRIKTKHQFQTQLTGIR